MITIRLSYLQETVAYRVNTDALLTVTSLVVYLHLIQHQPLALYLVQHCPRSPVHITALDPASLDAVQPAADHNCLHKECRPRQYLLLLLFLRLVLSPVLRIVTLSVNRPVVTQPRNQ